MTPIACMITDRRRLPEPTPDGVIRQVKAAASSGVHLVQVRERDLDGRALYDLARRAVEAVRGTRTRVIVNDRLDVALAAGAHGVHLRSASYAAGRVRSTVPAGFLIGRSVHSLTDAIDSANHFADFLVFGHVFDTVSKTGRPPAGLQQLADVARATPLPVLAVGGIDSARVAQVVEAGAAGFAAIGMFTGLGAS